MFQPLKLNQYFMLAQFITLSTSCTYRITILTHFFHEFQPWLGLSEWWSSLSLTFFLEKTEGFTTGSLSLSSQEPRGPLYLTWHRNWHWRNILSFTTNVEYTQNYGFRNTKLFKNMETYANTDSHIKPKRSESNNLETTKIEVINQMLKFYRVYRDYIPTYFF